MRIRKQLKQSLSLVFSTLVAVFAFSLLFVTIVDLQTDSTPQLVSDTQTDEVSQASSQPDMTAPQTPDADEQEYVQQEPPTEQSAAPAPDVEDELQKHKNNPKGFNIRNVLIVIGLVMLVFLATGIIAGIVLLIRYFARRRLYVYEDEDGEAAAEDIAERKARESDIYAHIPPAGAPEGLKPEPEPDPEPESEPYIRAETSSSHTSSFGYDDSGEADIDYVDIPRLFTV